MFKRVGVLAVVLTAGALLQPVAASAQDRFDRGHDRAVRVYRDQPRFTREYIVPEYAAPVYPAPVYVAPAYREGWNHDRVVREDRDRFVQRGRDRR